MDENGKLHITLSNCSLTESYKIKCSITDTEVKFASARILSGDPHDYNSFENSNAVTIKEHAVTAEKDELIIEVPPCSVIAIEVTTE